MFWMILIQVRMIQGELDQPNKGSAGDALTD